MTVADTLFWNGHWERAQSQARAAEVLRAWQEPHHGTQQVSHATKMPLPRPHPSAIVTARWQEM